MKLAINVNDKEYSRQLARALSKELKGVDIVVDCKDFDYEINCQQYKSIGEICCDIETALPGATGKVIKNQNCMFVCFCSANGGVGVSAASLTFARILSRIEEKKVFYLNTTPIAFLPEEDEFGVHSMVSSGMNPVFDKSEHDMVQLLKAKSEQFDVLVIDTSFSVCQFRTLFTYSDKTVIVFSPERGCRKTEVLFDALQDISKNGGGEVYDFRPSYDEGSFSAGKIDIHGEFGSEVRELAKRLEMA